MTASRDPRRPLQGGRKTRATDPPEEPRKPLGERIKTMLELRRKARRRRRETARREKLAIDREKAAARPRPAASPTRRTARSRGERRRVERKPAAARAPARARAAAAAKRTRQAAGTGARRARSRARPAARTAAARITAFGERSSRILLAAAAPVVAAGLAGAAMGRRGLSWLAVALTPLRAVIAVTAIAAVLLGISQFVDYRGVAVGVDDYAAYSDVEPVAPAPQVDRRPTGDPHSYVLVPLAVLALALLVGCARGRWQLGRVISLLGVGVIAVSVWVDAPAGLDVGLQGIAYASVEAQLLEGFYVQLVSGAVLVAGGLLVSRYARPARRDRASTRRREASVRPLGARTA